MAAPLPPSVDDHLRSFLARHVPDIEHGGEETPAPALVVAFSGGPDSTALLAALVRWNGARYREGRPPFLLVAAHLDHGMDPGSADRAESAREIARELADRLPAAGEGRPGEDIAWREDRRPVPEHARPGEGPEEAARRVRYAFLDEVRRDVEEDLGRDVWVLTAHHRDDQAETVAMRILAGSGLRGLAGIAPRRDRDRVLRPLLDVPKAELLRSLADLGIQPLDDPTNRAPVALRNRVRHELLPALALEEAREEARAGESEQRAAERIARRLAAVAKAARGARQRLDARLADRLDFAPFPGPAFSGTPRAARDLAILGGSPPPLTLDRSAFAALPAELRPFALAAAHARAGDAETGAPYPASAAARRELAAQLARAGADSEGSAVGCDAGEGWRWEGWGSRLVLRRTEAPSVHFFYTVEAPGELAVPSLGIRLVIRPASATEEDALRLPPGWLSTQEAARSGKRVAIRGRRPGDRFHAPGASGPKRLKEVLDRARVPGWLRSRLPLLTVDGEIAWVAGLGPAHGFAAGRPRPTAAETAWRIDIRLECEGASDGESGTSGHP